jgi:hypothetical protein
VGFVIRISRVRVRIRVRVRVADGDRERGRRKRRRRGQGFCIFSLDFFVRRRLAGVRLDFLSLLVYLLIIITCRLIILKYFTKPNIQNYKFPIFPKR